MNTNPSAFTAAQLARALGNKRQTVARALDGIPVAELVPSPGKPASAWRLDTLPVSMRDRLEAIAGKRGFRSAVELLTSAPAAWKPAVPFHDAPTDAQKRALKRGRALLPFLQGRFGHITSAAEFEALGVRDYKAVFGHAISERHWRALYRRSIERDAGLGHWQRPDLYLDDNIARKTRPLIANEAALEFRELVQFTAMFTDPLAPTPGEVESYWLRILGVHQAALDAGRKPAKARRALLSFLGQHSPWLAKSPNALRVAFDRKWRAWQKTEGDTIAVRDGRRLKLGVPTAEPFAQEDIDRIAWHAGRNCGGRVAQAVRELVEDDQVSSALATALLGGAHSKSYVPRRLRAAVTPDTRTVHFFQLGRRAVDQASASCDLTYEGIPSTFCLCADDFTFPIYWYVPDDAGWFKLVRGQALIYIDFRTLRVLGFSLQPDKGYNSRVIRALTTRVFSDPRVGVPRVLYYERGIWGNSKILTGSDSAFSWPEVALGLREFGCRFINAIRARSKPVERVGGLLQDLMEGEPGYCGRDERRDCPERTRLGKLEVEREAKHPAKAGFYNGDQWEARFMEICERYNATPQEGKRLLGLSPDEGFEQYWPQDDPPITFDARIRYLLANDKSPVRVTTNGIVLRFGRQKFVYRNPETSRRFGQTLLAWFDPENPEVLAVTDMNRKHPFSVPLAPKVNALAVLTDPDSLATALANAAEQQSHQRTRYKVLSANFAHTVRRVYADADTLELGDTMARQREALTATARRDQREASAIDSAAQDSGMTVAAASRRPGAAKAARDLAKFLQDDDAETPGPEKKTYLLAGCNSGQRAYVDYLVQRLTEFRQAAKSFGQQFSGQVSPAVTRKIARSQLGCDLYAPEHFDQVCAYLNGKIDSTILGKRNHAQGVSSYHEFAEHCGDST